MDRGAWELQSMGLQRVRYDWVTNTFTFTCVRKKKHKSYKQARNPRQRLYCSLKQEGVAGMWSPANRWLYIQNDKFFQHLRKRVLLQIGKNPLCGPQSSSVHFSLSVMSDFLRPHGLQHSRLRCPSPTPGACSNSCLLSWWCHPNISSSVIPFSWPQSFPVSGSFPMSQFFASGGQSIEASALASVLPVNIQKWLILGLTDLISSKGLSRIFSNTTVPKHQFFSAQLSLCPTLTSIHDYWKNHTFGYMDLFWQIMSLLFFLVSTF